MTPDRAMEIAVAIHERKHAQLTEMHDAGLMPAQIARELHMPLTTVIRQTKQYAAQSAETSTE